MEKATQKQLDFIKTIESYVPEKFTGTTKQEATAYISKNISLFKEIQKSEDAAKNFNFWALEKGYH